MGSAQVDEAYGFAAVADVLADPFPPGLDTARVRLPTVPRLRSARDDASHHREYWRAHVWAALRRYQVAFEDPSCPPSLRADHARVADEARRLLGRATATHPISPLDSVACHAALKDLTAGAAALEGTVAALRGAPVVPPAGPPAIDRGGVAHAPPPPPQATDDPASPDAGHVPSPPTPQAAPPGSGVHGQDFFAPSTAPRGLDLRLSLRGARGLRRGRELAEGRPGADPVADLAVVEDPATDSTV